MRCALSVAAIALVLMVSQGAKAAQVIGVDFNGANGPTTSAPGWFGWNPGVGTSVATTFGDYGVNVFTVVSGYSFDGRNRNAPQSETGNGHLPSGLGLMYKDFVFVAAGGNQGRATLGVSVSGLTPNTTYQVAAYAFDNNGSGGQTNFTASVPADTGFSFSNFPPHESVIWTSPFDEYGTGNNTPPPPAIFEITTSPLGIGSFYAWGGDGVSGNAIATSTYLNGFSISSIETDMPTGDFDGDGDVDGRDFLAWQRGESPIPSSPGDLADWQNNYNGGALAGVVDNAVHTVAVPEPNAIMLAMTLGGVYAGLPRRLQATKRTNKKNR